MFGSNVGQIEYDARINTSRLRGDAAETDAIVRGTGDSVERTGEKSFGAFASFAKVGLIAATVATGALAISAFKTGVEYNTLQQTSRAALKTILGSAEAASDQMNKLNEFVRTSPFAKDIFIKSQQQLLGFGVAAKDVIPALDAIQNSVAAVGGSSADIESIVGVFAKIKSEGRLGGEALLQLAGYGIDAATIIGSQMGKSGAEIKAMASQPGGIPVDQIWDPLVNGLNTKFGGAADNVKNTWAGTADRISAAFRDLGSQIAAPFINPEGGGAAIEWGNKFADFLRAIPGIVAPAITTIKDFLTQIVTFLQPVTDFIANNKQAWEVLKMSLLAILVVIGLLIVAVGVALVGAFALLQVIINVAIWATEQFINWINFLGNAIASVVWWFAQLGASIYSAMVQFVGSVVTGVTNVISWFVALPGRVMAALGSLGGLLVASGAAAIRGFISGLQSMIGGVISTISGIPNSIKGFFAGAGGWLVSAGRSIVEGLVNGIKSAIGGALKAAADLGAGVKKAAESALGIKSPSTVFAEIGKNVVLGFAGGINSNSSLASSSVSNMMNNLGSTPGSGSLASLDSVSRSSTATVNLNISGIMARSRADERDIAKSLIGSVNEELRAKGVPQIGGGQI